jgi:hypothetical protein
MSVPPSQPPEGEGPPPTPPGAFTQEVQHQAISARVPEKVARGVFSTGVLVLQGPHEFVLDFLLRMAQPQQIVARVVLPISVVPSILAALRENLGKYQAKFGPPPALPAPPPNVKPPPVQEIYEQLKLSEDQLSGVYANGVMISHTAAEFGFDFITNFYPRSAVSCRVFLSAPQVPSLLATLTSSFQQYQNRRPGGQGNAPSPPEASPQ